MSQKRLATLQAQNAALKAELANLQSLDAARTQASAAPLPAVIGGQQAQSAAAVASSGADDAELAAAQSEDKVRPNLPCISPFSS
jgi:hypothetical protein